LPKQIPSSLTDFNAYRNGSEYLGVADVELPNLEAMTQTLSGAGIAGEIEIPILGLFGSMTTTINWRTLDKATFKLARLEAQQIDFRGSIQGFDTGSSTITHTPLKVTMRVLPKNTNLGSLTTGNPMESGNELEVIYIKIIYDGVTVTEIDRFNYICIIDGVDYSAKIRANLGE
jgi:hypothetical protein